MRKHINSKDQSQLVQALNREFTQLAKMNRFATAVVATYHYSVGSVAAES